MPITSMVTSTIPAEQLEQLIAPIARAAEHADVASLAAALEGLESAGALTDALFLPPRPQHYARNLIYRHAEAQFIVVAMTWGPGQGSPLHDHAGLWGAEIVAKGTMNETTYELLEHDGDRYRFARGTQRDAGPGAVSKLIPPLEYHAYGNAGSGVAHTLHVYGGELRSSHAFTEHDDGWWSARRADLHYDNSSR
jgi:3-mercaptopropionate dioxygenase